MIEDDEFAGFGDAPTDYRREVPFELIRSDDGDGDGLTLRGYAAVFDSTTRIDSWEGQFDEKIARGAFRRTIAERKPVMQFDHGRGLIGSLPIGNITRLREDKRGLYVEARLFDNWAVQPIRDAIAGQAISGMSFRFNVPAGGDTWKARKGDVPLRTLTDLDVPELGPVVFPAYKDTEVGVRAREVFEALRDDDVRRGVALLLAAPNLTADDVTLAGADEPTATSVTPGATANHGQRTIVDPRLHKLIACAVSHRSNP
jgi:HK97 family phage prohead protease